MLSIPLAAIATPSLQAPGPATTLGSAAILGPVTPTAPLRLADACLGIADLPAFTSDSERHQDGSGPRAGSEPGSTPLYQRRRRALIVTGPRAAWHTALEDEDDPWLRNSSDYDVRDRLQRVDMRYCPSARHVRLLLTLLTSTTASLASTAPGAHELPSPPAVIVLYDLLSLLADEHEDGVNDENRAPGQGVDMRPTTIQSDAFATTPASAYLDLIAAARSAATFFGAHLLVLEPRAPDALPIAPAGKGSGGVPPAARERKVPLSDTLRRLLGEVVLIEPKQVEEQVDEEVEYAVVVDGETSGMRRRRCARAEFAMAPEGEVHGAWEWVWV